MTTRVTIRKADEAGKPEEDEGVHRLTDIVVREVSLVDRAANKRRFLVTKRQEGQVSTQAKQGTGTRGFVEDLAAEVAAEEEAARRATRKNDGGATAAGGTATGDAASAGTGSASAAAAAAAATATAQAAAGTSPPAAPAAPATAGTAGTAAPAAAPAAPAAAGTAAPAAAPAAAGTAAPAAAPAAATEETQADDVVDDGADPTSALQTHMDGLDAGMSAILDLDDSEAKRRVDAAAPLLAQAGQILATGQVPAAAAPVAKAAAGTPEEEAAKAAAAQEDPAAKAAAAAVPPPEPQMKQGADGALLALATDAVKGYFDLVNMLDWTVQDAKSWYARRFVEKLEAALAGMGGDAGKADAVASLQDVLGRIKGQQAEAGVKALADTVERMKAIAKRAPATKRDGTADPAAAAPPNDAALAGLRTELAKRDGQVDALRQQLAKAQADFGAAAARLATIEKSIGLPSSGTPDGGGEDESDGTTWPLDMAKER